MPFSRTTATRVPAGTVTFSFAVGERFCNAGRSSGATGGGAAVCGPSGCWAKARPEEARRKKCKAKTERVRFTSSLHAIMRCGRQRYGCLKYTPALPPALIAVEDLTEKVARSSL